MNVRHKKTRKIASKWNVVGTLTNLSSKSVCQSQILVFPLSLLTYQPFHMRSNAADHIHAINLEAFNGVSIEGDRSELRKPAKLGYTGKPKTHSYKINIDYSQDIKLSFHKTNIFHSSI